MPGLFEPGSAALRYYQDPTRKELYVLVLTRKEGEKVIIIKEDGSTITITVTGITDEGVTLDIHVQKNPDQDPELVGVCSWSEI